MSRGWVIAPLNQRVLCWHAGAFVRSPSLGGSLLVSRHVTTYREKKTDL